MVKLKLIVLPILLPLCAAAQCSSSLVSSGSYPGQSGPAAYLVFMPPSNCYNGDMILFAHGYVAPGSPANAWLSQLALPDGTSLPALVNGLGFGFAASSFSKEGLAILQGIQDTKTLTAIVAGLKIPVQKYFITGASEGGLVTAKSVENDPSYAGEWPFADRLVVFGTRSTISATCEFCSTISFRAFLPPERLERARSTFRPN